MTRNFSIKKIGWTLLDRYLPGMAFSYRRWREQSALDKRTGLTPWGFKLSGNLNMGKGEFEQNETDLVRKLLADVDVLVNVGANIGYYCMHALSMGKEVIAFEPIQSNLDFLCKNVVDNDWSCEIIPLALSKKPGILKIYGGGTGASLIKGWAGTSENYFTYVPCSTMDIILQDRLRGKKVLFVVDVEGAEQWVLEGSTKILQNDPKPLWLIEIVTSQHQPDGQINPNLTNTFDLMFKAGYKAVTADPDMKPINLEEVVATQNKSAVLGSYNFLFS